MTHPNSWFDGLTGSVGENQGRSVNRLRILRAVRTHGPISRADLAKHSRLSPPTVSTVVDELASGLGLVRDRGPGVSKGGRRPILVEFNADYGYLAGVDLGSRVLRAGICDLQGRVLARRQEPTHTESREATLAQVIQVLHRLIAEGGLDPAKLFAIGIGAPGMTDVDAGRVISAVNLPGFEDVPLRQVLEDAFHVPAAVDNDANMAALGERWMGCARGRADFVFLAWGAGVGAGLVVGGRLHRGSRWFAGEISHMHLDFRDWARDYGAQGFLESRVGASALPRLLGAADGPARALPPAALFEAAADGDPHAQALVDGVVVYLGTTVANITAVLDPSLVVFGGGLSCAGEHLMRRIEQVAARIVPNVPEIRLTALGDEAQLYGSLYSALQLGERRLEDLVTGRAGASVAV
jgi:glucokinase